MSTLEAACKCRMVMFGKVSVSFGKLQYVFGFWWCNNFKNRITAHNSVCVEHCHKFIQTGHSWHRIRQVHKLDNALFCTYKVSIVIFPLHLLTDYHNTGWPKSLYAPNDYNTEQSPHNRRVEDGHHRIHSECGPCYNEHSLREHSLACQ